MTDTYQEPRAAAFSRYKHHRDEDAERLAFEAGWKAAMFEAGWKAAMLESVESGSKETELTVGTFPWAMQKWIDGWEIRCGEEGWWPLCAQVPSTPFWLMGIARQELTGKGWEARRPETPEAPCDV